MKSSKNPPIESGFYFYGMAMEGRNPSLPPWVDYFPTMKSSKNPPIESGFIFMAWQWKEDARTVHSTKMIVC
jgi:hypothetical protein